MSNRGTFGFPKKKYESYTDDADSLTGVVSVVANSTIKEGDVVVNDAGIIKTMPYYGEYNTTIAHTLKTNIPSAEAPSGQLSAASDSTSYQILYVTSSPLKCVKFNFNNLLLATSTIYSAATSGVCTCALKNGSYASTFIVTSTTFPHLNVASTDVAIDTVAGTLTNCTCLSDGNIVVTQKATATTYPKAGIFNLSGVLQGTGSLFNFESIACNNPNVRAFTDGGFLATWKTSTNIIRYATYDNSGTLIYGPVDLDSTSVCATVPAMCQLSSNKVVVNYVDSVGACMFAVVNPNGTIDTIKRIVSLPMRTTVAVPSLIQTTSGDLVLVTRSGATSSYPVFVKFDSTTFAVKGAPAIGTYTSTSSVQGFVLAPLPNDEYVAAVYGSTVALTINRYYSNTCVILGVAINSALTGEMVSVRFVGDNSLPVKLNINATYPNLLNGFDHRVAGGCKGSFTGSTAYLQGI